METPTVGEAVWVELTEGIVVVNVLLIVVVDCVVVDCVELVSVLVEIVVVFGAGSLLPVTNKLSGTYINRFLFENTDTGTTHPWG
jgi:hypothetical protein